MASRFCCSDLWVPRKCSVRRTGSVWQIKYNVLSCVEKPHAVRGRWDVYLILIHFTMAENYINSNSMRL